MTQVLILATLSTKRQETQFLVSQLRSVGVTSQIVDISLQSDGKILAGAAKCMAMSAAADQAIAAVTYGIKGGAEVVMGIGGGTGGEIVLQVMKSLPITYPKVLVTTLPFDPRFVVADNSIIVVPTLADVAGLNSMLRDVLENAALMTAGLCLKTRKGELDHVRPTVGITALGATEGAIGYLKSALTDVGRETAIFHANGFGGAAFARFAEHGAFDAVVDLTPHELTRIHLAGVHAPMPMRFLAGGHLPRVVLPGGLNFIGLGQKSLVQRRYLKRPHYEHSGFFTHVKITNDEMQAVSLKLAESVNILTGSTAVIVPMGGFSHHDGPGGAIEDADLRAVCLETLTANLRPDIPITICDSHISDPDIADRIMSALAVVETPKDAHD